MSLNLLVPALTLIPLASAVLVLLLPSKRQAEIRAVASGATFLTLAASVVLFFIFDPTIKPVQFVTHSPWVSSLGISFFMGLDGMGLTMVLLHSILSFCGALVSKSVSQNVKSYYVFYLLLVSSIFGVFTSLDLFFLYLFYEMSVIPLYPMIGIWGSQNKEYAAMKLTLYISLGAVLALVGLMALYFVSGLGTFNLLILAERAHFTHSFQVWCAPLLIFGFGVIASLWPFHSWSPIGYAAAPTAVSMLHAGVLKKLGIFLTLRIVFTLLPEGAQAWLPLVAVLCIINVLYGAWAAMAQKDLKFVIGFASVSHMGYAFLGMAAMNSLGLTGTIFFMFAHGIMAALCFALIGFIYDQTHTRMIPDLGGLAKQMPFISICFIAAAFASSGLPGFANFISEILIFFAAWDSYRWLTMLAILGIVITATYMLRLIRNVFFGPLKPEWQKLKDAEGLMGKLPYGLLVTVLLIFGLWPSLLLSVIRPSAEALIQPANIIETVSVQPQTNS